MTFKLEHFHVKTRDPAGTARFYMDTLGATLIEANVDQTHFRVDLHGVTLNITDHVAQQKRVQKYGIEHFAVQTDDFTKSFRR